MEAKEEAQKMYNDIKAKIPKPTWFIHRLQYWIFKKWYVKRSCYNVIDGTIHFLACCNSFKRVNYWQKVKEEMKLI